MARRQRIEGNEPAAVEPRPGDDLAADVNEVRLVGRVSAEPDSRELPSGDVVVQLRVVVNRPPSDRKPQVDTIDVACWSAPARRSALRQKPGDVVEVHGALRRRFYRAGEATVSRYEVEAVSVRKP
jgi:single-strand DNA-binding protein